MTLKDLLGTLEYTWLGKSLDVEMSDIVYDSRKAEAGNVFVCMVGAATDGHKYARKAVVEQGCRAVVLQKGSEDVANLPYGEEGYEDLVVVTVEDTRHALALMSDVYFGHPSGDLKVIGITGTKGKTTTTYIIQTLLNGIGYTCGVVGTNGAGYGDVKIPTVNTTPESYELQKIFRIMADGGCKAVAIEVSSIGVQWHRVDGVQFFCGIFTNISPDHIGGNEHKTFEEYYGWKKAFFSMCDQAIGCAEDPATEDMLEAVKGKKIFYGYKDTADYRADQIVPTKYDDFLGVQFELIQYGKSMGKFEISQPGEFSVQNAMAALAVGELLGFEAEEFLPALKTVAVPGRAQIVYMSEAYGILIDFAHNAISYESIITTMRAYNPKRIIVLGGSVGDRAQLRRRELGTMAVTLGDYGIFTEDDPGYESPEKICAEIAAAAEEVGGHGRYVSIPDRNEALKYAVDMLQEGDMLLCLGKGHEKFMKRNGKKYPFDEEATLLEALRKKDA